MYCYYLVIGCYIGSMLGCLTSQSLVVACVWQCYVHLLRATLLKKKTTMSSKGILIGKVQTWISCVVWTKTERRGRGWFFRVWTDRQSSRSTAHGYC